MFKEKQYCWLVRQFVDLACERGRGLRNWHLLRDTVHASIKEFVMFLHTVGHSTRNRTFITNSYRSGEIISHYFHSVLQVIGMLKNDFIIGPSNAIHPRIMQSFAYWPYFEDCVGAINGTHIETRLPVSEVGPFCGRKQTPLQNVLAAVDFNTKFTDILAGWEGSAHDAIVLRNAIEYPNGLRVPTGKYYLADAGYSTRDGFITPYRGTRYQFNQFQGEGPQTYKELFNYHHSSLRMMVKRAFGLLKNRFAILAEGHSSISMHKLIWYLCIAYCTTTLLALGRTTFS